MKRFVVAITSIVAAKVACLPAVASVDPTRPATSATSISNNGDSVEGELALQSIFKRSTGYSAIISGKSYRVGDTINEYTISKINPKNVVITDGRQQKILRMYAYEIKK